MKSIRGVRFVVCGAFLLGALSCTGREDPVAPTGSSLLVTPLINLQDLGLVKCKAQPTATASAVVGPAGGEIIVGAHRLVIPAGALSEDVQITAIAESSKVRQVSFQPEGLSFAVPARLTLSYAECKGLSLLPVRIAYTTDALLILEYLLSVDDRLNETVSADLDHFSKYAVAW